MSDGFVHVGRQKSVEETDEFQASVFPVDPVYGFSGKQRRVDDDERRRFADDSYDSMIAEMRAIFGDRVMVVE